MLQVCLTFYPLCFLRTQSSLCAPEHLAPPQAAGLCLPHQEQGHDDPSYEGLQFQGQPFSVSLLQGGVSVGKEGQNLSLSNSLPKTYEVLLSTLARGIEVKTLPTEYDIYCIRQNHEQLG